MEEIASEHTVPDFCTML